MILVYIDNGGVILINYHEIVEKIKRNTGSVILGKEEAIELLMTSIICSGHILIEDVPGVGKTTLAKALAKSVNCSFKRIQFTPDLMPSDLTGVNVYNQASNSFEFRKGPVFTNILLADEINRATPRTQSSLLECMEEHQVTVDGETYKLEKPFFVMATQNPVENYGTFPLPEAQLDRFFMKISMGYPKRELEEQILGRTEQNNPLESLETVCTGKDIAEMQKDFTNTYVNDDVRGYILDISEATRKSESVELGASPRASMALYKASQAYAYIKGRDYVKPDDIIYLAPFVLAHRLIFKRAASLKSKSAFELTGEIVRNIKIPMEDVKKVR